MKKKKGLITTVQHPDYRVMVSDWNKWRLTYQSGRRFVNAYLKRHSLREEAQEFAERKAMTYCPAFAKEAVDEIMTSIYQRLADIKRIGGDETYSEAVEGQNGGVDLQGSSMANFMGQIVLRELLPMKKVGIYVDMPALSGETILDTYQARPYLYTYAAEDIRTWSYSCQNGAYQYTNVLLRDYVEVIDPETGMPSGTTQRYRRVWLDSDGVHIKFTSEDGSSAAPDIHLPKLKRLPFINLELNASLLNDIADYQITLLNLASTDIMYLIKANYPFYTEEYEPRSENFYSQNKGVNGEAAPTLDGAVEQEIKIGTMSGRRFPKGMKPPSFIHPSSEPITASMAKQTQLKAEIRELVGLALATLQPMHASAESKQQDQGTLVSGLSAIGLTLEYGEREIAKLWAMYLGQDQDVASTVNYPEQWAIKSDSSRMAESQQLAELQPTAPSIKFKKEVSKEIARTLLERKVDDEVLQAIYSEIDDAPYIDGTALSVQQDVIAGIVSAATASLARGYEGGQEEVDKAQKEHIERLKAITIAQTPPPTQGNPDTNPKPGSNTDPAGKPLNPGAGRPSTGE